MNKLPIKIKLTEEAKKLYPNGKPEYESEGSSGFDIRAVGFADCLDNEVLTGKKWLRSSAKKERNGKEEWIASLHDGENGDGLTHLDLYPKGRILIKTGLFVEIPKGYELQIRPRSGLALKHGISITNSPATIDSDYRGEICVILENRGYEDFEIKIGDRIAQGVIAPVYQAEFEVVDTLEVSTTSNSA